MKEANGGLGCTCLTLLGGLQVQTTSIHLWRLSGCPHLVHRLSAKWATEGHSRTQIKTSELSTVISLCLLALVESFQAFMADRLGGPTLALITLHHAACNVIRLQVDGRHVARHASHCTGNSDTHPAGSQPDPGWSDVWCRQSVHMSMTTGLAG